MAARPGRVVPRLATAVVAIGPRYPAAAVPPAMAAIETPFLVMRFPRGGEILVGCELPNNDTFDFDRDRKGKGPSNSSRSFLPGVDDRLDVLL